jgi:hypothetical protein
MSMRQNSARAIRAEGLRVDAANHPDWVMSEAHVPQPGEDVLCTGGLAEVVRVLGKTGDGSRLLELRLHGEKQPPFFVAASNVLQRPA